MHYVYILQSQKNHSYYIGSTSDLSRRLSEHNAGHTYSTKNLRPLSLIFSQSYPTSLQAIRVERWLKSTHNKNLLKQIVAEGKITKRI